MGEGKKQLAEELCEIAAAARAKKISVAEAAIEPMLIDIRNMCLSTAQFGNMSLTITAKSHSNFLTQDCEDNIRMHWDKFKETLLARFGLGCSHKVSRQMLKPGERSDFELTISW